MDKSDINKIATRKRMSADVENLRQKITNENKKIIKLKVAQDTAYWDLKEKLRQVETNHEKLQQNMLEVQMQYETVSGQYQDELRHRAETLNKLASTREICSVLEDYCERLRDTLSRCKADQGALYEAYQQSGQLLKDMKNQQLQQGEQSRQTIENLEEKVKMVMEHSNQLSQHFNEEKQRSAAELQEERRKLATVMGKNTELLTANTELGALVDHIRRELQKKDEINIGLQRDIKQLIQEFNSQASDMKNNMLKQDKDLKEATASNESLKQALHNQEAFTKTVCEQRNQLQEKLACVEEEQANSCKIITDLEAKLQVANDKKEDLQREIADLNKKVLGLEKDVTDKSEIVAKMQFEIQKLGDQLMAKETEKAEVILALNNACEKARESLAKIQELTDSSIAMEQKLQEIENDRMALKNTADLKIKELTTAIEEKDKELTSKTSTISDLINEIKRMSDSRKILESSLQNTRQQLSEEKDSAAEVEKRLTMRIQQLEKNDKEKDAELSKNLTTILGLRNEKDRLNEKIESMQNKIDNVQKELTRPAAQPDRVEPEQDDNAVMLTPAAKRSKLPAAGSELGPPAPPPPPRKDQYNDSLLFNFMSDNSMDSDATLDVTGASAVNRHFGGISRGEHLSPVLPSSLKRARNAPRNQQPSRYKQTKEELIPLSQLKTTQQSKARTFFKTKRHGQSKPKYGDI